MTEYKENVWYGWNGGECPVHASSRVDAVFLSGVKVTDRLGAQFMPEAWEEGGVIAFRVVKEHREPREFWLVLNRVYTSKTDADVYANTVGSEAIRVREVLE